MREHLEQRLQELKAEFEKGDNNLKELEAQAANVRQTLLRISGAIQVLEELLAEGGQSAGRDGKVAGETPQHATVHTKEAST